MSVLLSPYDLSQIKEREFINGRWHYLDPYELTRKQLKAVVEFLDSVCMHRQNGTLCRDCPECMESLKKEAGC